MTDADMRCSECVWQNRDGDCEKNAGSLLHFAPYFRENPDIEVKFGEGSGGNDCAGFEGKPVRENG